MNKLSPSRLVCFSAAALAMCVFAQPAGGQEAGRPGGAGEPIIVDAEEFQTILNSLTPEQVEMMIEAANEKRMAVERRQTIAEIRYQGLLYDPQQIDEATTFLEANPAGDRLESIARISEAFAIVDRRLAEVQRLLGEDDPQLAVAAARKIVDPNQATYLSAAAHLLYADALRASGDGEAAVEAYREVFIRMPERLSFAAEANLRAAEASEKVGRFLYALQLYRYCARNYSLTLTADEYQAVNDQIHELQEIYKAPLTSLAGMMDDIHERLDRADSGQTTQQTQDTVVAVLEDLIKTAEEQQQQGGGSSSSSGQQEGDGESEGETQQGGRGSSAGDRPTSPMRESRIVPGRLPRPVRGATVYDTDESGDWANLPPRERTEIQEIARRNMSERHRRMTSKYHTRLTEEGSR